MNPSLHISGAGTLAFAFQLLIVAFLIRSLTAFLLRRNPDSPVGKALAYML